MNHFDTNKVKEYMEQYESLKDNLPLLPPVENPTPFHQPQVPDHAPVPMPNPMYPTFPNFNPYYTNYNPYNMGYCVQQQFEGVRFHPVHPHIPVFQPEYFNQRPVMLPTDQGDSLDGLLKMHKFKNEKKKVIQPSTDFINVLDQVSDFRSRAKNKSDKWDLGGITMKGALRILLFQFDGLLKSTVVPKKLRETTLLLFGGERAFDDLLCDGNGKGVGSPDSRSHKLPVKYSNEIREILKKIVQEYKEVHTLPFDYKKGDDIVTFYVWKHSVTLAANTNVKRQVFALSREGVRGEKYSRKLYFLFNSTNENWSTIVPLDHGNLKDSDLEVETEERGVEERGVEESGREGWSRSSRELKSKIESNLITQHKPKTVMTNMKSRIKPDLRNMDFPINMRQVYYIKAKTKKELESEEIIEQGFDPNMNDGEFLEMLDKYGELIHSYRPNGGKFSFLVCTKNSLWKLLCCSSGRDSKPIIVDVTFNITGNKSSDFSGYLVTFIIQDKFSIEEKAEALAYYFCHSHTLATFIESYTAIQECCSKWNFKKDLKHVKALITDFEETIFAGIVPYSPKCVSLIGGWHDNKKNDTWVAEGKKLGKVTKTNEISFKADTTDTIDGIYAGDEEGIKKKFQQYKQSWGQFLSDKFEKNVINKPRIINGLSTLLKSKMGHAHHVDRQEISDEMKGERIHRTLKEFFGSVKNSVLLVTRMKKHLNSMKNEDFLMLLKKGEKTLKPKFYLSGNVEFIDVNFCEFDDEIERKAWITRKLMTLHSDFTKLNAKDLTILLYKGGYLGFSVKHVETLAFDTIEELKVYAEKYVKVENSTFVRGTLKEKPCEITEDGCSCELSSVVSKKKKVKILCKHVLCDHIKSNSIDIEFSKDEEVDPELRKLLLTFNKNADVFAGSFSIGVSGLKDNEKKKKKKKKKPREVRITMFKLLSSNNKKILREKRDSVNNDAIDNDMELRSEDTEEEEKRITNIPDYKEVIHCIGCGQDADDKTAYNDLGNPIQCTRCEDWCHPQCMKEQPSKEQIETLFNTNEQYTCFLCVPVGNKRPRKAESGKKKRKKMDN